MSSRSVFSSTEAFPEIEIRSIAYFGPGSTDSATMVVEAPSEVEAVTSAW